MFRAFISSELHENNVESADETHFVINMDNGSTLGFEGRKEVKWVDVVSDGENMTMVVRLSGGWDSRIENSFMLFKHRVRNHPIRGVLDTIEGVSSRTGPEGWMDSTVKPLWLKERQVFRFLPNDRRRVLYVDSCSGHVSTDALIEAANEINAGIR